eukprot:Em0001g1265a
MVDQAEGSQTDAQRGVQSTSANPAGFSGDDLMTLIRQSVQSILRESQLPTPNPPAPVVNATPPAILGRMPEPATVAGLHIPLVVPNAGASVLATDTMYLPPVSQISGASSAEVTASGLKKEQSLPFLLSEGLPTIPYKIVKKITNGEFVDMAELLRDNIEAERRASMVEGQKKPKAAHTARREIPDLLSWVQCFGTFIAIMASVYPGKPVGIATLAAVVRAATAYPNAGNRPRIATVPTWLSYTRDLKALAECRTDARVNLPRAACIVSSPLRVAAWAEELKMFPDREFVNFLIDGITVGFRIGYKRKGDTLVSATRNMLSAEVNPSVISEYLDKELRLGRVVGPLPGDTAVHVSRFGVVPKSTLADALCWIVTQHGVRDVIHYLDDYLVVGDPGSSECEVALNVSLQLCERLGVPIAEKKLQRPTTSLTFLGIELDTVSMELRLPQEKLHHLKDLIQGWKERKSCSKRELQSLIGHLQHACKVVRYGRSFLHRMINLSTVAKKPHHHTRLSRSFRADLAWWSVFLEAWNGISVMNSRSTAAPSVMLTSDASGSWGCGAFCSTGEWFQFQWPPEWSGVNITAKELFPLVVGCAIWGDRWCGKVIRCLCDNAAVVAIVKSGSSKDDMVMHLVRTLFYFSAKHDVCLSIEHIAGSCNRADSLSRNSIPLFNSQVPGPRLDVRDLDKAVALYFAKGLALSTQRSYESGYRRYVEFCHAFSVLPTPVDEQKLLPSDSEYDAEVHLGRGDLAMDDPGSPSFIRVCIKQSKTDPFCQGAYLYVGRTGTELCPVAALLDYLCVRGPGEGPLFRFEDGRPLTRLRRVAAMRLALEKAGINQTDYCSHSFRIRAATTAAENRIEDSVIKTLGRWKSAAYQQYVRIPTERLVHLSAVLATSTK